jgi:hypothetical protein
MRIQTCTETAIKRAPRTEKARLVCAHKRLRRVRLVKRVERCRTSVGTIIVSNMRLTTALKERI